MKRILSNGWTLLSTVVFNTKNDFWPGYVRECFFKIESIYKDAHLERTHLVTIKDKRNKLRDSYHALRFIDQKFNLNQQVLC